MHRNRPSNHGRPHGPQDDASPDTLDEATRRRALLSMLEDLEEDRRNIEQARREWTLAFDAIRDPVFIHDIDYRIVRANRAYAAHAGRPFQDFVGQFYWEVFPRGAGPLPGCRRVMENTQAEAEEEIRLETGETFLSRSFAMRDAQGAYLYSVHVLEDVTEKRKIEAEQRILSAALQQAAEAIVIADAAARIRYVNSTFSGLLGYAPAEIVGQPLTILAMPDTKVLQMQEIERLARADKSIRDDTLLRARDGTSIPAQFAIAAIRNVAGEVEGFVGTMTDLRAIKRVEVALRELATHDGLTGLYNHRAFYKLLEDEQARAKRFNRSVSLLMIDIDHFKRVNDAHGHQAGDAVLKGLSEFLRKQARAIDRVCRYGGEEITVILPEIDGDAALNIAERMRVAVENRPFDIGGERIGMTVSIGVAVYPAQADTPDKLVAAADLALYTAKLNGRNRVCRYEPGLRAPGD